MSDWQVGDLALRVRPSGKLRVGVIYTVADLNPYWLETCGLGLILHEVRAHSGTDGGWAASGFVKVTPPAADDFDREVIELYQRTPVEAKSLETIDDRAQALDGMI